MAATLVIVDMQDDFHAAKNPVTISAVLAEVKKAMRRKSGVVVVQMDKSGRTLYPIERLLCNYPNVDYVWKYRNDGGKEVYDSIIDNMFDHKNILVCGVNTDACVCETVQTLSMDLPYSTIKVVEEACNSVDQNDFSWIDDLPNVVLMEAGY